VGDVLPFRRPEPPDLPDEIPCPRCGHDVDRARIRCPRCGASTLPAPPRRGLPGWMWIGVLLAALVLLGWVLRG
jgi:hypothetical protein